MFVTVSQLEDMNPGSFSLTQHAVYGVDMSIKEATELRVVWTWCGMFETLFICEVVPLFELNGCLLSVNISWAFL